MYNTTESELHNTTEPKLPHIYLTDAAENNFNWEKFGWLLLAIFPLLLVVGIPLLWMLYHILRCAFYLTVDLCMMLSNKLQECEKNCNCSADVEWKEKGNRCEECDGSCQCIHMGRMETDTC